MSYCLSNISTLCFRVHVSANTYEAIARSVGVINDNIVHALCQVEK